MPEEQIQTPMILAFDYTYLKLLGEGANGKTWLARSKIDGNLVAIKELKTALMEDLKALELFKREAETLQSLSVPGVPTFYKSIFPEDDDADACYLVQEYVPYPSIQERLNQDGAFSEADTLQIMAHLANTLLILQTKYTPPIIHRDIKPSNILYQKNESGSIQLALIDFGAVANPQKRTGGSTIAGTFGYMAPEQLQGECSIQSDFYALGATAIHMLTNVSPYTMPTDVFRLDYKPVLREKAPNTSPQMIELLDMLIAVKASGRPQTASDLLKAIQNVQAHKSPRAVVKKNEPSSPAPFSKLSRFFGASYSSNSPEFLTTPSKETWKTSDGIARGYKVMRNGAYAVEYTFKHKNIMYVGIDSLCVASITKNIKFPIVCTVSFNPEDPHINYLKTLVSAQGTPLYTNSNPRM